MEAKPLEGEGEDERKCRSHIALLCKGLADPVAEVGSLGHAAAQIGEADSADQDFVVGENEQVVGLVGPPVFGIAGHSSTEARPTQRVDGPAWLPRYEKISGTAAQARPVFIIAALGRAQEDTLAGQAKRLSASEKDAGKGFALRRHRYRSIKRRSDLGCGRTLPADSMVRARRGSAEPSASERQHGGSRHHRPFRCAQRSQVDRIACRGSEDNARVARSERTCSRATSAVLPSSAFWHASARSASNHLRDA